jgi:hypothetical protein
MRSGRAAAESSRLGSALLTPENPEADPLDAAGNRAGNSRISLPPGEGPGVEGVARVLDELAIPLVVGWRGRGSLSARDARSPSLTRTALRRSTFCFRWAAGGPLGPAFPGLVFGSEVLTQA